MDQGLRLLCPVEARKLLLLLGITVALVIVVQCFEFPSSRVLSSLFSARNTSSFLSTESSKSSEMQGNLGFSNGLNSSDVSSLHETRNGSEASNIKKESAEMLKSNGVGTASYDQVERNKSSSLENGENSFHGYEPAQEKAMASLQNDIGPISPKNKSSDANFAFPPAASPPASMDSYASPESNDAAATVGKNSGMLQSTNPMSGYTTQGTPAAKRKKAKRPSKVISISQMNDLLWQSRTSSQSVRPRWPSEVDQEMMFAKSQIENAAGTENDPGLYAPIYRNVSMFQRSYELMQSMLKVYIYQEGEKPIFHQSILNGIYASEGWFLKLMEANEHFVTNDPGKAHLFYIPFSSRLLELTLYKRKSHSRANLIQFMANYVDMIATKYSFWNRTTGADHFLAACHDWAPAETRGRMLNCIRALCNADIEAGFSIGKDVSLPETYVHSAENPHKNLEGNSPSQRSSLAFFAGNVHGYVRPILLDYWENKDPDMKIFGPMPHVKGNTDYIQHMKSSKFCICPKGFEVNSPRIMEAIYYECVPVIISDNYVPPFFEVLDWESFAVFVLEKDIPDLKNILLSISKERYVEMHKRVKKVQRHFLWHTKPVKYDLFHMILHSVWYNRVFQMKSA